MENGENKVLQGRREFFKQASKRTLPIIGAIALMRSPVFAQTFNSNPTGCESGCEGCSGGCQGCTGCTGCSTNDSNRCGDNIKSCTNK